MKPICMSCGKTEDAHIVESRLNNRIREVFCPKQFIPKFQWLKFDPAFIPKAPLGFVRSTWRRYVSYHSKSEGIRVNILQRDFLKSRDPKSVLRLAIDKERAILRSVQKTSACCPVHHRRECCA